MHALQGGWRGRSPSSLLLAGISCRHARTGSAARSRTDDPPLEPSSFPAWRPLDFFHFEILHQSTRSAARVGRIHTPHGAIDTPGFVAVGTNAALKHVDQRTVPDVQLMFVNTYHMLVHPGPEVVAAAGGLHAFMRRDAPLITDSGGFQIFSMQQQQGQKAMPGDDAPPPPGGEPSGAELKRARVKRYVADEADPNPSGHGGGVRVGEAGVTFRSYRDGTPLLVTSPISPISS